MSMSLSEKFEFTFDIQYQDCWMLALVAVSGDDVELIDIMDGDGDTPMILSSDILEEVKLIARCVWMEEVSTHPSPDAVF